jgi:CRISPR system Cascade subunit CasA
MQFNLLDEFWIPVTRQDGTAEMIAPWQVTDRFVENPIVSLNAPRADFNGALIQFLIGLVQTVAAPKNNAEWRKKLKEPPSPEELKLAFSTVHHAFELGGNGPKFMQDFDTLVGQAGSIDGLLIGDPGENALKNNTDFFIKRKQGNFSMCPACSAAALFSIQTNAPAGGRGYMTSLRGGGPLTTIIISDTLWLTVWLNVLELNKFHGLANSNLVNPSEKFPWLAKTKTNVSEQQIHPAQYFWATPRRINLAQQNVGKGKCDVCTAESDKLISEYLELPNGTKYQEPMKHHLSAFNGNSTKAVLTQQGGVTYRHWLGLIITDSNNKNEPARVIHEFIEGRQNRELQFRVWAFGYDFVPGQNKARCWYDSTMPLHYVDASIKNEYEHCVANMVKAAVLVGGNLRIALKNSMHGKPKIDSITGKISWEYRDIKKLPSDQEKRRAKVLYETREKTTFVAAESFYWQNTEPHFYKTLHQIKEALEIGGESLGHLKEWHRNLCDEAQSVFDSLVWEGPIENSEPKRIVLSRSELKEFNKNIINIIGL